MGILAWIVLGLIAGGEFQDPLREGATYLTGSTHKTFPGPQRGVILGNLDAEGEKKYWPAADRGVFPGSSSNHHLFSLPALVVATREMKQYGCAYAAQTVRNAQALGRHLDELPLHWLVAGPHRIRRGGHLLHPIARDFLQQSHRVVARQILEEAEPVISRIRASEHEAERRAAGRVDLSLEGAIIERDALDQKDGIILGQLSIRADSSLLQVSIERDDFRIRVSRLMSIQLEKQQIVPIETDLDRLKVRKRPHEQSGRN